MLVLHTHTHTHTHMHTHMHTCTNTHTQYELLGLVPTTQFLFQYRLHKASMKICATIVTLCFPFMHIGINVTINIEVANLCNTNFLTLYYFCLILVNLNVMWHRIRWHRIMKCVFYNSYSYYFSILAIAGEMVW